MKKIKRKMRENWMLGFLGFLGFNGIPELLTQDWFGALWLLWFLWFLWFMPECREQSPLRRSSRRGQTKKRK